MDRVVGRLIATVFLFLVLILRNPYALGMQVRENQDTINNVQDRYTGDDDVIVTNCAHVTNSSETTKRSPGERRCKQRHELESGSESPSSYSSPRHFSLSNKVSLVRNHDECLNIIFGIFGFDKRFN